MQAIARGPAARLRVRIRLSAEGPAIGSFPPDRQLRLLRPQLQRLRFTFLQYAGGLLLPIAAALSSRDADPEVAGGGSKLHQTNQSRHLRDDLRNLRLCSRVRPTRPRGDSDLCAGPACPGRPAQQKLAGARRTRLELAGSHVRAQAGWPPGARAGSE